LLANILFSALLLLSYLSVYISPEHFAGFAFLGLIYSFLFLINIFFLIFWIFFRSWFLLISTISILIGWNYILNFIQPGNQTEAHYTKKPVIKILSYNVRIFNLWEWSPGKDIGVQSFNFIRNSNANIVCLQEFYSMESKGKNAEDSLLQNSGLKNAHISYSVINKKKYNHGIATFSSYPIIFKGNIVLNENDNFCIYSDIKINEDTLRVYNIHLQSVHFGYDDYQLIENIESGDSIKVKQIRGVLNKLKRGYQKRAKQSEIIAKHIEKSKYPIVLCGDFNDTPNSYVYHVLTKYLIDSFCESGSGIGSTYIKRFSTFRIDYIMHSDDISSYRFSTPQIELSDHFPVECKIQINK